jgi:hypothetical protein
MKRSGLLLLSLGLILLGASAKANALTTTNFDIVAKNAVCLSSATGHVTVLHREETEGVDTLHLNVSGLPANTDFTVFLTSADAFATPPFGVAEYIGDFTTNGAGVGSLKVDAIVGEAFVSAPGAAGRGRTDLDHLVIWFADPAQVPSCFNNPPSTPFDGDGVAGTTAMSSQGATGLELFP